MKEDGKVVPFKANKGVTTRIQARKLLDRCREHSLKHLKSLLRNMLDNADDALFTMADKAQSNTEQSLYFDSMRIVRLNRHEIESRFYQNIEAGFDRFWGSGAEHVTDPESAELYFDDLSLVGEQDLEESLAMINLTNKIKQNFSQEINAINQRLDVISDGIHVDDNNNPMGPKLICNAFNEATQALDTDLKIKLIIYKLFDTQMMASIGHLFDVINNEFITAGVLPRIKVQIRHHSPTSRPGADKSEEPEIPLPSSANGLAENDVNFLASLQQLLAQTRGTSPKDEGHTGSASSTISLDKVVAALTALQHDATPVQAQLTGNSSDVIRSAMQAQFKDTAGHTPSLNSMDSDIIDIVAMMFDFILDDPNLPDRARALIGRLQIPMLKVAILDKSFFANRTHPARKLLNELAAVGLTLDNSTADDQQLLEEMSRIVNRVLDEFSDDISLFEALLTDLDNFQRERQIEEKSGLAEARRQFAAHEQMELARSWVRETLRDALGDTRLPVNILRIIMGPWHDVMTHTYLNQGGKSTLWKNQLRFVDVLVWSVQPKQIRVDRDKLSRVIQQLMDTLRSGLQAINYPADKITRIFAAVEPYHQASLHGLPATGEAAETRADHADNMIAKQRQTDPNASFFLFEAGMEPNMRNDEDDEDATLLNLDQRKLRENIEQMEQQLASLDELGMVFSAAPAVAEGPASAYGTGDDFDQEITRDIAVAGWDAQDRDVPVDYPDAEYLELVRQLEIGRWVEMTDAHNNTVRAKLAWKSEILDEYTFTNWKFEVIAEKSIYSLATDLRKGTARIINDVPLLDRALSAVAGNLADRTH